MQRVDVRFYPTHSGDDLVLVEQHRVNPLYLSVDDRLLRSVRHDSLAAMCSIITIKSVRGKPSYLDSNSAVSDAIVIS